MAILQAIGDILTGIRRAWHPPWLLAERAIRIVEDDGTACPTSPSGNHFGVYQMSDSRARDVGYTGEEIHCDPEAARDAFWADARRYAQIHQWEPAMLALNWKAGPGAAKWARTQLARGRDWSAIWRELEDGSWILPKHAHPLPIPGVREYMRRFAAAFVAERERLGVSRPKAEDELSRVVKI